MVTRGVALLFRKTGIMAGYTPLNDWNAGDIEVRTKDNFFHSWIPSGSYKNLTLLSIGQTAYDNGVMYYSGQLILFEVPIRRSYLSGSYDYEAGVQPSESFQISSGPAANASQQITINGKVKIGNGPNQEIVTVVGAREFEGASFDPSFRLMKRGTQFLFDHKRGEPIEEYIEGVDVSTGTSSTSDINVSVVSVPMKFKTTGGSTPIYTPQNVQPQSVEMRLQTNTTGQMIAPMLPVDARFTVKPASGIITSYFVTPTPVRVVYRGKAPSIVIS